MAATSRSHPSRSDAHSSPMCWRVLRTAAVLLSLAGVSALVAVPAVAEGAAKPAITTPARAVRTAHVHPASALPHPGTPSCSNVSAASVSAAVGWTVPAPYAETHDIKPSAPDGDIAFVETECVYGTPTSSSGVAQVVTLCYAVASKYFTPAQVHAVIEIDLAEVSGAVVPFDGLGFPAWYYTASESGWTEHGVAGLSEPGCPACAQPTDAYGVIFGVFVQHLASSAAVTMSTLGALAMLAGTI